MTKNTQLSHHILSAPPGVIFTTSWLEQHGISSKLAWWYVRTGLLERLWARAYKKMGDPITWVGAIEALQNQMNLPLHIGGITSLQLLGRADTGRCISKIMLFADLETGTPSWLDCYEWRVNFEIFRTSLFNDKSLGVIECNIEGLKIKISCPERAAMEMLYLAPKYETLFHVTEIMEEIGKLEPEMIQALLENCNSIKIKRFFLYFIDRFFPKLLSKLDLKKINLGNGKRMIGCGGRYRYHPKFMLSLPVKIHEEDEVDF
jgi:hypothetical protein